MAAVLEPDVFDAQCGSRRLLTLISDKWAILVLYALSRDTMRPAELRRLLDGVSQKMLTQTLRKLEADGLVARVSFDVVPPHVEYSLTRLGESLEPVLTALCEWSEEHATALPRTTVSATAG